MDDQSRKELLKQARKWKDTLSKRFDDVGRAVTVARRQLTERHGKLATEALLAEEEKRLRREALPKAELDELDALLGRIEATLESRPRPLDEDWRQKLPRRAARPAPIAVPEGYLTDREIASVFTQLANQSNHMLWRFADLMELPRMVPAELVAEAMEAAAANPPDLDRYAMIDRELHQAARDGTPDIIKARDVVASVGINLPPPPNMQAAIGDFDALHDTRKQIEQSIAAISTGNADLRTAEASAIITEEGADAYLAQRAAGKRYRAGQHPEQPGNGAATEADGAA